MADNPTPADLGNLTESEFLSLAEWAVNAQNAANVEDTIDGLAFCVNAVLYRILREQFRYINEALACRVDTPLSLAAKAAAERWREGDNRSKAVTLATLGGAGLIQPSALWSCSNSNVDEVGGASLINDEADPHPLYGVVNAPGSRSELFSSVVWGLRPHAARWYFSDVQIAAAARPIIMASCQVTIPHWNQANEGIVLLKHAAFDSENEIGAERMGFEFGLERAGTSDPNANSQDYVPYVRWYDSIELEQRAVLSTGDRSWCVPSSGAEWTLGFLRYEVAGSYFVDFYINGILVGSSGSFSAPLPSVAANMRVHAGADQLGFRYCEGTIRNVFLRGDLAAGYALGPSVPATMLALHRIGAGFQ